MSTFTNAKALSLELSDRISRLIHEDDVAPGTRLNENRIAGLLGVSRTPVRSALKHLEQQGYVARERNRGVVLVARPPMPSAGGEDDALLVRIARDRRRNELADELSEQELMDRYGLTRVALRQTLERMAALGVMERKLGYGWRFMDDVGDETANQESYRFRMVIEPQAIREEGYALAPEWIREMRLRHQVFLTAPWTEGSSISFFEMNAQFHEGVAAGSGNRYFMLAVQGHNRLRRLSNYDWNYGRERVEANCREHLKILDRLEAGDHELAAELMQRHLAVASRVLPTWYP